MGKLLRVLIVEDSQLDAALLLKELSRGSYDVAWETVETAVLSEQEFVAGAFVKNAPLTKTPCRALPRAVLPSKQRCFSEPSGRREAIQCAKACSKACTSSIRNSTEKVDLVGVLPRVKMTRISFFPPFGYTNPTRERGPRSDPR